jgi:hypothetical protein
MRVKTAIDLPSMISNDKNNLTMRGSDNKYGKEIRNLIPATP